jgi:hypothetical protein
MERCKEKFQRLSIANSAVFIEDRRTVEPLNKQPGSRGYRDEKLQTVPFQ